MPNSKFWRRRALDTRPRCQYHVNLDIIFHWNKATKVHDRVHAGISQSLFRLNRSTSIAAEYGAKAAKQGLLAKLIVGGAVHATSASTAPLTIARATPQVHVIIVGGGHLFALVARQSDCASEVSSHGCLVSTFAEQRVDCLDAVPSYADKYYLWYDRSICTDLNSSKT